MIPEPARTLVPAVQARAPPAWPAPCKEAQSTGQEVPCPRSSPQTAGSAETPGLAAPGAHKDGPRCNPRPLTRRCKPLQG